MLRSTWLCSRPLADALRPRVAHHKEYSTSLSPQTYPDANSFYVYIFSNRKLLILMKSLNQAEALTGGQVRVSEVSLRPRLWQLCEQAFPNRYEDQPTPPNAFRDEEEWSEVEDGTEPN